ncbi:type II secretion system F family protein [Vibrio nigripulchritudo]|nr:type II secretion system F family protein [Vibrio nigripulchritudo]
MKFVVSLSGGIAGKESGAAFVLVTEQLNQKLFESYPEIWQKPIEKYLYKTIHMRSISPTPEVTYSLEPFITKNDLMVLGATEEPIAGLDVIIKQGDSRNRIMSVVKASMRDPLMYLMMTIGLAWFTQENFVAETIVLIDNLDAKMPYQLQIFSDVNSAILDNLYTGGTFIILMLLGYNWATDNLKGSARTLAEKVPMFGTPLKQSRLIQSGLFLQSIALLYKSGVNTKQSLKAISNNSTRFMVSKIGEMQETHGETGSDIEAFRNDLFDKDTQFRLSVYFELSDPTSNMDQIASTILETIEQRIISFSKNVALLALVAFSGYLGLFILATMAMDSIK